MQEITVSGSLHHKSPLDTLVRQSSRRAEHSPRMQSTLASPKGLGSHDRAPPSPLLHTRFRTSASTAMSADTSFVGADDTATSRDMYWRRESDDSVYSIVSDSTAYPSGYGGPNFAYVVDAVRDQSPTLPPSPTPSSPLHDRDSWSSHSSGGTVREGDARRQPAAPVRETWRSSAGGADPFSFQAYESPAVQVPTLVVSSPRSSVPGASDYERAPARSPSGSRPSATQYSVLNFSRPIRPPTIHDEESKREVLDRNRGVGRRPPQPLPQQGGYSPHAGSPAQQHYRDPSLGVMPPPEYPYDWRDAEWPEPPTPAMPPSSSANAVASKPQISTPDFQSPPTVEVERSMSTKSDTSSSPGHVRLLTSPPSPRPTSRVSLYSTYSYYQLEDGTRTPSPASARFPAQEATKPGYARADEKEPDRPRGRKSPSPPSRASPAAGKTTPDEYLYLGIKHHEANRLEESARCFERAATADGGCGVGMLMWGLSLRHAWGTAKDEKTAFRWLRRAAEAAVGDLEAAREGKAQEAVQTELVLAIYEVGQCFFHGWGVPQDKKMAVSYFQVAARLGDGDAQQELGYCLANGKGCKKNLKEAAKWYRAAAAQGASTIGLTWIFKPKYA